MNRLSACCSCCFVKKTPVLRHYPIIKEQIQNVALEKIPIPVNYAPQPLAIRHRVIKSKYFTIEEQEFARKLANPTPIKQAEK